MPETLAWATLQRVSRESFVFMKKTAALRVVLSSDRDTPGVVTTKPSIVASMRCRTILALRRR